MLLLVKVDERFGLCTPSATAALAVPALAIEGLVGPVSFERGRVRA